MSSSDKPRGDLEDSEGVTTDSEGHPQFEMEVLEKSGGDGSEKVTHKMDTEE